MTMPASPQPFTDAVSRLEAWTRGEAMYGIAQNSLKADVLATLAEIPALRDRNAVLLRAIVEMALPYEALRMDGGSRRWIAPTTWKLIVEATDRARALLSQVDAARGEGTTHD